MRANHFYDFQLLYVNSEHPMAPNTHIPVTKCNDKPTVLDQVIFILF